MISIGLIGCGAVVHQMYSRVLIGRSRYRVAYVCDLDPNQAASAAALFGAKALDLAALTEHADAVVISTPPSTHHELIRACLRDGRKIICEKPYMTSGGGAATVADEARQAGASLYVGHFRRTFPQLELARRIVQLGLVGKVTGISACEGGRFAWKAVSGYTVNDPNGGVLWDTGSHTLDMALYASGLDHITDFGLDILHVEKDKTEPSHEFLADFRLELEDSAVNGHIHVSRKEALPNLIEITGTEANLTFVAGLDDRVRIATGGGSTVIHSGTSYRDVMENFDMQLQRILLSDRDGDFSAENFIGQIKILEALAGA